MSRKSLHPASKEEFFAWINERHAMYIKRHMGLPKPWTHDPILRDFKFTNVFRNLDRTTEYFHQQIRKHHKREHGVGQLLFNCALFRYTGTQEFWEAHGWVTRWRPQQFIDLVEARKSHHERVYTGAYMINNVGCTAGPKSIVLAEKVFTPLWKDRHKLTRSLMKDPTLEHAYTLLQQRTGFGGGGFMAYEVVTDLRHWYPLDAAIDINTFANPGPGAIRGLTRIYGKRPSKPEAIQYMRDLLEDAWDDDSPLESYMPVLELRDIEHSLCEFDKYCRVKFGEGRPRSRYPGEADVFERY